MSVTRKTKLRLSPLTLILCGLVCAAQPLSAQTRQVTLAWDPNTEPEVAGYIVYVGNASRAYIEEYDVGDETEFVYTEIVVGRPYYFAVAAYAEEPDLISPLSAEVLFLDGASQLATPETSILASATAESATAPDRGDRVVCSAGGECFRVDHLASSRGGSISALTPTGDGRLLFVQDKSWVRVIAGGTLIAEPALGTSTDATQLAGIAADPAFAQNHFVYVGEVRTRPDGSRELDIVRYREVQNVLGEGAVVIAALPLPATGDAAFTTDAVGRLYVALPDTAAGRSTSPYGGMVLRFESNGSVSPDSPAGSPVIARGYRQPTSLVWSAAANDLLLAGNGADWVGPLVRLPLNAKSAAWPDTPQRVDLAVSFPILSLSSGPTASPDALVLVDQEHQLFRISARSDGVSATRFMSADELGGNAQSAAIANEDIYVVLTSDREMSALSEIVRLRAR
jgi:hypothetical protein